MSVQSDKVRTILEHTLHSAKLEGHQVMTGGLGSTSIKSYSHVPEAVEVITTVGLSSLRLNHVRGHFRVSLYPPLENTISIMLIHGKPPTMLKNS